MANLDTNLTTTAPLDGILASISLRNRKLIAKDIAKKMRASQSKRLTAQQNPDGSAFAKRKDTNQKRKNLRMFNKLRTARFLRQQIKSDTAVVGFVGNLGSIPFAHQYGLPVTLRRGLRVRYEQRQLLGYSANDIALIENQVLDAIANGFDNDIARTK